MLKEKEQKEQKQNKKHGQQFQLKLELEHVQVTNKASYELEILGPLLGLGNRKVEKRGVWV